MTDKVDERKGWVTPYGFGDFTVPVSYSRACELMGKIHARSVRLQNEDCDESTFLKGCKPNDR